MANDVCSVEESGRLEKQWSLVSAEYHGAHPRELPRERREKARRVLSPPLEGRPYLVFLNESDRSL